MLGGAFELTKPLRRCEHAKHVQSHPQHFHLHSIRQHTLAYASIRQNRSNRTRSTSSCTAYVSIRQHSSAFVSIHQQTPAYVSIRPIASAALPSEQHTHTSASVTPAYVQSHVQHFHLHTYSARICTFVLVTRVKQCGAASMQNSFQSHAAFCQNLYF
jgi:hypothetical protein